MNTDPVSLTDRPPTKWSWYEKSLKLLQLALSKDWEGQALALRAMPVEGGRDSLDVASEIQNRDELLTALDLESVELAEIDAALERIRRGTYGVCEATGKPIPKERLRAIPWTRYTRDAAAEVEKRPRI